MNVSVALYDFEQIAQIKEGEEKLLVILGFKDISRFYDFSKEECLKAAEELKKCGHKVFLQWDILMTEDVFGSIFYGLKSQGFFESHHVFDGLRVQDSGLLYALKEIDYSGDVHFIAENGNHNLRGLKSWLNVWPSKISRLVVSPQLTAETIREYAEALKDDCELEVLGLGPILLFYTPRKLVSPLYGDTSEDKTYHVQGTSEESPHKGFPIIENRHGTFMLNTKDQFIFDELIKSHKDLLDIESLNWRIDPICGMGALKLQDLLETLEQRSEESLASVKASYGRGITKGFFRANKTDVLFKKLKNHRLQDRDESFVGEVVDVKKKKHIAVWVKSESGLKEGDTLKLLSPEGREKTVTVEKMTNGQRDSISSAAKGQIAFIPPVGGISVKTMVYHS